MITTLDQIADSNEPAKAGDHEKAKLQIYFQQECIPVGCLPLT